MKPLIGMTPFMQLAETYYQITHDNIETMMRVGALPVILPYTTLKADIKQIAELLQGLVVTGGDDINPHLFGEEPHPHLGPVLPKRDLFELALIEEMLWQDKPILGICRGCQILNIALDGDMYQDIHAQCKEKELRQHQQKAPLYHASHTVEVVPGSLLAKITGSNRLRVNSRHHQANRQVHHPLQVSARALDGVIEAIESTKHRFVLGVQWHPENMFLNGDEAAEKLFQAFIRASSSS